MAITTVCVFAGSSPGAKQEYVDGARQLGAVLAAHKIDLVYGAGAVGLMGALADGALDAGGKVTGVIPAFLLNKEVGHPGLSELEVVQTMHQRKQRMFERSDAFIALPGGMGTLEETFEVLTWAQLGFHSRPFGLLNVAGYYDELLAFLDTSTEQRFIKTDHRNLFVVGTQPDQLLAAMNRYVPVVTEKWIDRNLDQT